MADDTCTGEIWEGDPLTAECQCFKERSPIFKVDGSNSSTLQLATSGSHTPTQYDNPKTIENNTKGLKICRWKNKAPLRAGIKSNCADVTLEFLVGIAQTYPLELGFGLVSKRIRYRAKYADAPSTIVFPFSGSWTFNQYILVGGVPTAQAPMTLSLSDLTVNLELEDPCIWDATTWSASFSDDQATNDGWNIDPGYWDANGSTQNNLSVHYDGNVGIYWRFYNTLVRAGAVTYGPLISCDFYKAPYGGDDTTPYGFTTVSEEVNYP